jgi:hypothetical protein
MPIFVTRPDVVDRGHSQWVDVPDRFGLNREINWDGVQETVGHLWQFKHSSDRAFGHLAYMPEYAQVLEATDTRVLFNIRDPRDVVVAEYYNAMRQFEADPASSPLWNFFDKEAKKRIFEKEDPISDLIILAAARWPRWLDWMEHDFVKTVKYEDLRLNTRETLEDIMGWLDGNFCAPIDTMVQRALPRPKNPTFRKGNVGDWKRTFKLHHTQLAMVLLGDVLGRMGYE